MQLDPLQVRHAERIALIHAEALAGDFLPSLGANFLKAFYQAALRSQAVSGFAVLVQEEMVGFILGSSDTRQMFREVIVRAPLALAWAAIPALLRRPALLRNVAETFLYPRREAADSIFAELVVIALQPNHRGCGAGKMLVKALNESFCQQGIVTYKVSVLHNNANALRFYQQLGFQAHNTFRLYGKEWDLLTFSLDQE